MQARDIAISPVVIIDAAQNVHAAAELMERHLVGCLVVTECLGSDRVPVGMLTDRDICVAVAHDLMAGTRSIRSIMSRRLVTCRQETPLENILEMMRANHVRRLPVVDEGGALAGILTASDVLNALSELIRRAGEVALTEPALRDRLTATQIACDGLASPVP
ncbi:CBS domain-containing protein [Dyella japonica]|uniref:CBS domain-containing protein n=1 Tax=Dyella japonica TaxID=231455 RepID=A0ABV2JP88_9GAMM